MCIVNVDKMCTKIQIDHNSEGVTYTFVQCTGYVLIFYQEFWWMQLKFTYYIYMRGWL